MRYLCLVLFCISIYAESLQMHVHNAGQGNAVFLKNGGNALIVDFGAHQSGTYRLKKNFQSFGHYKSVLTFLQDVQNIVVVVTHAHTDHHSLFQYLPANIYSKIKCIYASTHGDGSEMNLPQGYAFESIGLSKNISNESMKIPFIVVDRIDQIQIRDVLGEDVQIFPVLPTAWPTTGKSVTARSADANDNSISLVVKYGDSKVLLTGDSTGATLNAVQKVPENIELLKNITCIILPHHGSNLNGAFSWFYFVKSNIINPFSLPLLTIISSDPKECDHLPWAGVSKFTCDRPGGASKVPSHIISAEQSLKYHIDEPVYVTANAEGGFFRVIFDKNGKNALYDGDPVQYAPDLLRVPVQYEYESPQELIRQWENFNLETKKEKIKFILESIGSFSTELHEYIAWISQQLISLRDGELFLLAIKNLNSFAKEPLLQKQFSTPLLQYLSDNVNDIAEDIIMTCLINHQSLFLNDLYNNFSGFLHKYLLAKEVSIKLVTECLRHHETLFQKTEADLANLLLNKLENGSSYEDWRECMAVAMDHVRDKGFLSSLLNKMPI